MMPLWYCASVMRYNGGVDSVHLIDLGEPKSGPFRNSQLVLGNYHSERLTLTNQECCNAHMPSSYYIFTFHFTLEFILYIQPVKIYSDWF